MVSPGRWRACPHPCRTCLSGLCGAVSLSCLLLLKPRCPPPNPGPQPCAGSSEDISSTGSFTHAPSAPGLSHAGRSGLGAGSQGVGV